MLAWPYSKALNGLEPENINPILSMSSRYFQINQASRVVETKNFKFTFEPYNAGPMGSQWGVLKVDDPIQADELAEVARSFGVFEIDENDYRKCEQKKSTLNINRVHHGAVRNKAGAAHVEAKNDGETSSDVDSVDDLLTAPSKEEKSDPTPKDAQETEPDEPAATEPEPAPKKKTRGRKKQSK